MYLRNTWYAAIWGENVGTGEAVHRRILGEPIALFRGDDGVLAAVGDTCPHRFAPLSAGRVVEGNRLQCPYHGLVYDRFGQCVRNPHGSGRIPKTARVKSYPVVERHLMAWIWMGDQAPDPAIIPDYAVLDAADPGLIARRDYLLMDADYLSINDNLLDLSHISFLHDGILGNADTIPAKIRLEERGRVLLVGRHMPSVRVPGMFDLMYKRDGGRVDFWADMHWSPPSNMMNSTGVTEPGADRGAGVGIYGFHLLTPETDTTTHYHFTAVRWNPRSWGEPVDSELRRQISELRRMAFEEQDRVMIAAQHRAKRDPAVDTSRPILLDIDAGPVRAGRILHEMIRQEQEASGVAAE
jgi:vanillate O-demethylase monooxygenase subunit